MQIIFDIERKVNEAFRGFSLSIENLLQLGFILFRKPPGVFIVYSIVGVVALSNPMSGLLLGGPIIAGYNIVSNLNRRDPLNN